MARNKHPEATVQRIVDTAMTLFLQKGYEHTSIQDIIDGLVGLSRGAIYHHFRSKEDILLAVMDRLAGDSNRLLAEIRDRTDLSGREKLETIFRASLARPEQEALFALAPRIGSSPQLLSAMLWDTVEDAAPHYLAPILRQGVADGSLAEEHPEELAELLLIAANVWMNPMVLRGDAAAACRRFRVFAQMLRGFGLDLLDEPMLARLQALTDIYEQNK